MIEVRVNEAMKTESNAFKSEWGWVVAQADNPSIPEAALQKLRQRISLNSKPAWITLLVPSQPRQQSQTLSQIKQEKSDQDFPVTLLDITKYITDRFKDILRCSNFTFRQYSSNQSPSVYMPV